MGWSTCGAWTWSPRAPGTSSDLNGVAYGNGMAVAQREPEQNRNIDLLDDQGHVIWMR